MEQNQQAVGSRRLALVLGANDQDGPLNGPLHTGGRLGLDRVGPRQPGLVLDNEGGEVVTERFNSGTDRAQRRSRVRVVRQGGVTLDDPGAFSEPDIAALMAAADAISTASAVAEPPLAWCG